MIKSFNKNEITEKDYNFIVSNLILSQTKQFTYYIILNELTEMFEGIDSELESVLSKCLIRLREDGFLSVLGSNYNVIECNI